MSIFLKIIESVARAYKGILQNLISQYPILTIIDMKSINTQGVAWSTIEIKCVLSRKCSTDMVTIWKKTECFFNVYCQK